jgi:hypothetical protein
MRTSALDISRYERLPGYEILAAGLADLWAGRDTISALMTALCRDRLVPLGVDLPRVDPSSAAEAVHRRLADEVGDDEHARYNALLGRMVSLLDAAEGMAR